MKYLVNGIGFSKKADIVTFVRAIIARHRPGELLATDEFEFILALLDRHPCAHKVLGVGAAKVEVYMPELWAEGRTNHTCLGDL